MIPGRWLFILSTLLTYSLPWTAQSGAALTLSAYDLAEWSSLHPVVREGFLPFAVTFGLRIIPALLLVVFVVDSSSRHWERLIMTALIAIALLPPVTFFLQGLNDANHCQQMAVSILTLAMSGISITMTPRALRRALQSVVSVIVIVDSIWSLATALNLMHRFSHAVQPGAGSVLFILILMIFVAKNRRGNFWQATSQNHAHSVPNRP